MARDFQPTCVAQSHLFTKVLRVRIFPVIQSFMEVSCCELILVVIAALSNQYDDVAGRCAHDTISAGRRLQI
jgi:hypothetical protein